MPNPAFTPAVDCTHEQRPDIALAPITSNKLHAVGYCPQRQILAATFAPGGLVYHYEGFSQQQYDDFMAAESKGRHFGQHIQVLPSKKYGPDPVAKTEEDTKAEA